MMGRPACQKDSMVSPMMMLPNVKSKSRHSQSSCLGFGFVTQASASGSASGFLCRHSVYGINMLIAWDPGGLIDVATHVVHYSNTFLILNPSACLGSSPQQTHWNRCRCRKSSFHVSALPPHCTASRCAAGKTCAACWRWGRAKGVKG